MIKSVYIHIPFCSNICSYCDFCKLFYHKKWVHDYLNTLKEEIKKRYKNDILDTIYIGGGTPTSLTLQELKTLFDIIKELKVSENLEYTIECNLENLTKEKLLLMKEYGINRLSIGVETFQKKFLKFLKRKTCDIEIIKYAKEMGFQNINIDLIYALPNQTLEDVKNDIKEFIKLDITHISTYSLMIEPNTILYNQGMKPISEDFDAKMYQYICKELKKNGFFHYEISNFCKPGFESKHNLTYWDNNEYYGFGLGASGYIHNIRYTNTRSIHKYLNQNFILEQEELNERNTMIYEMILGLRKRKGISFEKFQQKFHKQLEDCFEINELLKHKKLEKKDKYIRIPEKYLYLSNEILMNFVGDENE